MRLRTPRGALERVDRPESPAHEEGGGRRADQSPEAFVARGFARQFRGGASEPPHPSEAKPRRWAGATHRAGRLAAGGRSGRRREFHRHSVTAPRAGSAQTTLRSPARHPLGRVLLAAHLDGQLVTTLLAAGSKNLASPLGRHPGTESVLVDPLPIARAICGLHGSLAFRTFREISHPSDYGREA